MMESVDVFPHPAISRGRELTLSLLQAAVLGLGLRWNESLGIMVGGDSFRRLENGSGPEIIFMIFLEIIVFILASNLY